MVRTEGDFLLHILTALDDVCNKIIERLEGEEGDEPTSDPDTWIYDPDTR